MKTNPMKLFAVIVILCNPFLSKAQESKNALAFEIGKTGLIYNLVYDHQFPDHSGVRIGAGANFGNELGAITFGGGAYYLFGKSKHFFETGIDLNFLGVYEARDVQKPKPLFYPDHYFEGLYPNINLGYRRTGKRTLFRIGCSPSFVDGKFVPGGYLGVGICF